VRVRPAANPAGSTVEEGRVTVTPFAVVGAEIAPQTSRGSRSGRHEVVVDNRGNAPTEVAVSAADPDRRLTLAVQPQRATVGPDGRAGFAVSVAVDDPFPFGPNRPRPFEVTVAPVGQAPIELRATLSQRALLPSWIPPLAGIALLAVVVGAGAYFGKLGPFAPEATPTPSPSGEVVTPEPSLSPSPGTSTASGEPTITPEPTATATPAASPTSPQIEVQFLDVELEDRGLRDDLTASQRQPSVSFQTDGPGVVTLSLTRLEGTNGVPARMCLEPVDGERQCEDVESAFTMTVQNDETGTRSWRAYVRPQGDGVAPRLDMTLQFNTSSPTVTWTDNAMFFGSPTMTNPGVTGFTAFVQGSTAPSLLRAQTTFTEQPATSAWGAWTVGSPEPPLTQVDNASSYPSGPISVSPGTFVAYRFVGISTFDGNPVTYSVALGW
jgi:hypothetical protein